MLWASFLSKLKILILLRENINLFANACLHTRIVDEPKGIDYSIQFRNEVSNLRVIFLEN